MAEPVAIGISATLSNARTIHDQLSAAGVADAAVLIDVSALQACDLSFVQMVEAFRRDAQTRGVSVTLTGPGPDCVRRVLRDAGLLHAETTAATEFWLQGETLQ